MEKSFNIFTVSILIGLAIGLCGCRQMLDLSAGDWYGTEELYILDDEGDPIRFYVNLHLLLGENWNYKMDITFSGTAKYEETAHYQSSSYSGTWMRERADIRLTNYGTLKIKAFSDKEMTLESDWPFAGRPTSELQLKDEELKEAKKQKTTITVKKTN